MYFNEFEPFAAQWLGKLFPAATVDHRSIIDVQSTDLAGYDRCHFFGGVGGWELALQLADWPAGRPVWTGSCPCQPYSSAGKQKGQSDARHLWPEMFRLIRECRPATIFGEQVEAAIRFGWLDGVFTDLEAEGYACGAVVLGAHSVGAPHIRQRIYWVADSQGMQQQRRGQPGDDHGNHVPPEQNGGASAVRGGSIGGMGESFQSRLEGLTRHGDDGHQPGRIDTPAAGPVAATSTVGAWSNYDLIPCRDGKTRRVESGIHPLVDGVSSRMGRLRGYGNAIVPQVAAEFVKAFLESR